MAVLYNSPILIALGVAAFANDIGLAIFVAMNEWTIRSMIGYVSSITETKSEIDGLEKVLETLKGDDTSIDEKPTMPEKMILKDVEFYYASDKDHRTPFKIPYFEIERGKRYRISGPSSAGKSTFFKYFAGEMEANKSFDVRTFYIHQRSELVYGTLRENITLGNKWVPDPVIEDLLRSVKLDHFMDTLPNGLDTIIGKDIEPSGGEQSRISLLRLFVHLRNYGPNGSNPITNEVIILDEVTSALDKRDVFIKDDELSTEEAVIKVIDRETKGSTMFVISHEDVSSNAFGFKDIVDEQMIIDICGNDRILKKMDDNKKINVTHQWGRLHKIM
jgi:ABC-type transport system involved in cytochrome bd biosynthesis fused ATPase/permease subunit